MLQDITDKLKPVKGSVGSHISHDTLAAALGGIWVLLEIKKKEEKAKSIALPQWLKKKKKARRFFGF